jgi:hypothetical protein
VESVSYDSRADTLRHSQRVGELMAEMITEALDRSMRHDRSKTEPPEVAVFDEVTPKLALMEYGSEQYRATLREMSDGLAHHYAVNRHHPEHFADGVAGMTLVDLVEMLADWKAATERNSSGDLATSLAINRDRFGIDEQLDAILANTADHFGWLKPPG